MAVSLEEVYRSVAASPFNRSIGGSDPALVGEGQSNILLGLPGLDQARHILDYGCGIGRTMPALYTKLGAESVSLDGCDISEDFIAECRSLYKEFPFKFYKIYAENEHYAGYKLTARSDYVPNLYYDYSYSFSVFTHFDLKMAANTLEYVRPLLRSGGRYYFTMFRLDEHSADIITRNASPSFTFHAPYQKGQSEYFAVPSDRLALAAMSQQSIEGEIQRRGWKIVDFYPGAWRAISMPNIHDAYLIEKE